MLVLAGENKSWLQFWPLQCASKSFEGHTAIPSASKDVVHASPISGHLGR